MPRAWPSSRYCALSARPIPSRFLPRWNNVCSVDGPEQTLFHRGKNRLGIGLAERAQYLLLGHARGIVKGTAYANANDDRRTGLRAGFHDNINYISLDGCLLYTSPS